MNLIEITRHLRNIESEVISLREDIEHELHWNAAKATIDTPRPRFANLLEEVPEEELEAGPALTLRDLEPEAAFVEQIEIFIHDKDNSYHVRLRFDDDTTEKLGIFSQYSSAYEYTREQARRYHVPIFDTTYEDLVD